MKKIRFATFVLVFLTSIAHPNPTEYDAVLKGIRVLEQMAKPIYQKAPMKLLLQ
jgi:hypothetical protein